jgi:hypothetical protein
MSGRVCGEVEESSRVADSARRQQAARQMDANRASR